MRKVSRWSRARRDRDRTVVSTTLHPYHRRLPVARLHEHQGKTLLARHGLAVPRGEVVSTPAQAGDAAEAIGGRVVLKVQAWVTGRAARGGILFADDDSVSFDPKAVRKFLDKNDGRGYRTLELLPPQLETLEPWSRENIERRLSELCEQHGLKLADVAQPLRVAAAGRAVSPAIGATLVFLGRDKTLNRIRNCWSPRGAEA